MIHAGSITGAALSQGKTKLIGVDTSWTKYQDLRNDRSKRDFVTLGQLAVWQPLLVPLLAVFYSLWRKGFVLEPDIDFQRLFCGHDDRINYQHH